VLNISAAEVDVTAGWLDVASGINVNAGGMLRMTGGSVAIGSTLNLNSAGTIALSGGTLALNASGQFNWNGGTLRPTVNQSIGMNALIGPSGATLDTTDRTVTYTGNLAGTGGFTKLGTGTLIAAPLNVGGALNVNAGTLEIAPVGGTVRTGGLAVINGAALKLADNDLIVNYGGGSPAEAIRQLVRDGRANGSTTGIFSTPGSPDDDKVLAIADNAAWGQSSFNGITIDTDTVVGKYTYFGDANFDGKVTGDDYVAVDANLGTGDSWLEGDFNMSGGTTGDDYVAIDANLGKGTSDPLVYAELKAEMVALHAAMFGDAYLVKLAEAEANGFTTVPEPGAVALMGLTTTWTLLRRR
jgi:hypothetical protein